MGKGQRTRQLPVGAKAREALGAWLAALIARCQASPSFLDSLRSRCAGRAPLFEPAREREAVRALAHNLLSTTQDRCS